MKPSQHRNTTLLLSSISGKSRLCLAITAQLFAATAHAGPTGGEIVGGDGRISQTGLTTTIHQTSDRLAIDWQSFNVARDERVTFVQPGRDAIALNRILGNEGSQILGRIHANGHVILMNPNGVFFGPHAVVNAGGLVATGLNINTSDFLNGDLLLEAVEGTAGAVINNGIINASTGGNVALIGTQVTNSGLINARFGSVILASGQQAVVTFDQEGLLGIAIDRETLQSQLGDDVGVANFGEIVAEGGRILLTGSVSQDLFCRAVNSGGMNSGSSAIVHEDGTFTLGAGVDVASHGHLSVSASEYGAFTNRGRAASDVILVGRNVTVGGDRGYGITASSGSEDMQSNIHLQAQGGDVSVNTSMSGGGHYSGSGILVSGNTVRFGASSLGAEEIKIYSDTATELFSALSAQNVTLRSTGTITQSRPWPSRTPSGSLTVSNNLHLQVDGGQAILTAANNRIDQLSADIRNGADITVNLVGDWADLADIRIENATASINAVDTLTQRHGTTIVVEKGTLNLRARNLELSEEFGSSFTLLDGELNAYFTAEAQLENVDIPGVENTGRVKLSTMDDRTFTTVGRAGFKAGLLYVDPIWYRDNESWFRDDNVMLTIGSLNIWHLNSLNTTIYNTQFVTQGRGAIHNDGALNLHISDGGKVYLNNPENDFRRVDMNLSSDSSVELVDINGLQLGDISMESAGARITAAGTLSQANGSSINVNQSSLNVRGHNLEFNDDGGSAVNLLNGNLNAHFSREAKLINVDIPGVDNTGRVYLSTPGAKGFTTLGRQGFSAHVRYQDYAQDGTEGLHIEQLNSLNTTIYSSQDVTQATAIFNDGALNLHLKDGGAVYFNNPENQFRRADMNLSNGSIVELVDADSLYLGNIQAVDSDLKITTLAPDAFIRQANNTTITLNDSTGTFTADNIFLGHNTNNFLKVNGSSTLDVIFKRKSHVVNTGIGGDGLAGTISVTGDDFK